MRDVYVVYDPVRSTASLWPLLSFFCSQSKHLEHKIWPFKDIDRHLNVMKREKRKSLSRSAERREGRRVCGGGGPTDGWIEGRDGEEWKERDLTHLFTENKWLCWVLTSQKHLCRSVFFIFVDNNLLTVHYRKIFSASLASTEMSPIISTCQSCVIITQFFHNSQFHVFVFMSCIKAMTYCQNKEGYGTSCKIILTLRNTWISILTSETLTGWIKHIWQLDSNTSLSQSLLLCLTLCHNSPCLSLSVMVSCLFLLSLFLFLCCITPLPSVREPTLYVFPSRSLHSFSG